MNTGSETFFAGLLCGAMFGTASRFSRPVATLSIWIASMWMIYCLMTGGLSGLEKSVQALLQDAHEHEWLVIGMCIGLMLSISLWSNFFRR